MADKDGVNLTSVTVPVNQPITSVQTLNLNTQLSSDQDAKSGWYVVNIGFNNDPSLSAGPEDSKYPDYYARRDSLDNEVAANQRIVGLHGWTRLADRSLRAIGFIVAEGTEI